MSIRAKLKSLFLFLSLADNPFSYMPHLSEWHLALLSLGGLLGAVTSFELFPILGIFSVPLVMGIIAYIEMLFINWRKQHQS